MGQKSLYAYRYTLKPEQPMFLIISTGGLERQSERPKQDKEYLLTASDPCITILKSLTGLEPRYRVLVSDKSPVTMSNIVLSNTPFCKPKNNAKYELSFIKCNAALYFSSMLHNKVVVMTE